MKSELHIIFAFHAHSSYMKGEKGCENQELSFMSHT